MPMTFTHALVPVAVAFAYGKQPTPWTLVIAAAAASAAPDVDGLFKHFLGIFPTSPYGHRGAAHSLFVALACGLAGAAFHRWLRVPPLVAGVSIAAAMASHGILDMMTDSGDPVAYLWPFSSVRFFADWRPIHSSPVALAHLMSQAYARLLSDLRQLIVPMFIIAFAIRIFRLSETKVSQTASGKDS